MGRDEIFEEEIAPGEVMIAFCGCVIQRTDRTWFKIITCCDRAAFDRASDRKRNGCLDRTSSCDFTTVERSRGRGVTVRGMTRPDPLAVELEYCFSKRLDQCA